MFWCCDTGIGTVIETKLTELSLLIDLINTLIITRKEAFMTEELIGPQLSKTLNLNYDIFRICFWAKPIVFQTELLMNV